MKEIIEDKKLIAANFYFNLYMSTLEEFVDKNNRDVYLHESGDRYGMFRIEKKHLICWVNRDFWRKFSDLFSLQAYYVESIITKWVEDTYKLKGIVSSTPSTNWRYWLMIPTN